MEKKAPSVAGTDFKIGMLGTRSRMGHKSLSLWLWDKECCCNRDPLPCEEEDRRDQPWDRQGSLAAFSVEQHKILISNEYDNSSLDGIKKFSHPHGSRGEQSSTVLGEVWQQTNRHVGLRRKRTAHILNCRHETE